MEKTEILKTWGIRLTVVFVASQVTGLGIGYCLAGYFVFMFLFQFFLRLFLSLIGLVFMVMLLLTLFIGLLTL
ncbi:MAG: hypothetical protein ACK5HT_03805 [Draconibacterium sp.]